VDELRSRVDVIGIELTEQGRLKSVESNWFSFNAELDLVTIV
jgi:hypothetical protein